MCLVELPREVERESAPGGVVYLEVAIAEDDGIGLVGVEEVVAAQIDRECAQTAEAEILLHAEVAQDAGLGDAEVVVVAFGGPLQVGTQTQVAGQFEGVSPGTVEPRLRERDSFTSGSGRLVVLEHGYKRPCGMPAPEDGKR